jgi:hypothetical protein
MSNRTPLTPANCDLTGLPNLPLNVTRLTNSDLIALTTGDEFKAAVLLWAKSWHQVPAASLPKDDRILARLIGVSLSEWITVREGALRGFVECSDGRLYHPVVAEMALAAWATCTKQRAKAMKRWANRGNAEPELPLPPPTADAAASPTADAGGMQIEGEGELEGESPPLSPSREGEGVDDDDAIPIGPKARKDAAAKPSPSKPKKTRSAKVKSVRGATGNAAFDAAWAAWPKVARDRSAKAKALKLWESLDATPEEISAAVASFLASKQAKKEGGEFVPALERWLRNNLDSWLESVEQASASNSSAMREAADAPQGWCAIEAQFGAHEFYASDWLDWRACDPVSADHIVCVVRARSAAKFAALTRSQVPCEKFHEVTGLRVKVLPPEPQKAMTR